MVKMNVEVMSAILIENIPGSENREDIELLQVEYDCRANRSKCLFKLFSKLRALEVEDILTLSVPSILLYPQLISKLSQKKCKGDFFRNIIVI